MSGEPHCSRNPDSGCDLCDPECPASRKHTGLPSSLIRGPRDQQNSGAGGFNSSSAVWLSPTCRHTSAATNRESGSDINPPPNLRNALNLTDNNRVLPQRVDLAVPFSLCPCIEVKTAASAVQKPEPLLDHAATHRAPNCISARKFAERVCNASFSRDHCCTRSCKYLNAASATSTPSRALSVACTTCASRTSFAPPAAATRAAASSRRKRARATVNASRAPSNIFGAR
ncbi:hypothetical protein C8K36_102484 [Rhodococcus sp. OK519]|nr:hypothetical protein C8K36_102484 [Rhodococcus sp. OK519]